MELRDLAEAVLFGGDLDAKLLRPEGVLTDERPGPALPVPKAPGRPSALSLDAAAAPARFPRLAELDSAEARGRMLHFFANHELLAAELFALMLLRFPDAPSGLRMTFAATLADEQRHLELYRARMHELGVELGELPLSAFFWNALADAPTPAAFMAGMALTFEQANLDYAAAYGAALERVDDAETAGILAQVQADELGHVRNGVNWLEHWRRPEEDDWDAYVRLLQPPLTPRRAKGRPYLVELRTRVGLSPRFARELAVFSSSKGRQPRVFWFDPDCEAGLARGRPGHQPTRVAQALQRDYASLMAFAARQDDVVLVPQRPSQAYLLELAGLGFELPELVEVGDDPDRAVADLRARGVGGVCPWGWSPDARALLTPLLDAEPSAPSVDVVRALSSKAQAAELLAVFARARPELGELLGGVDGEAGRRCETREEVDAAVDALRPSPAVIKAPWGTSGRNMIRALEPGWTRSQEGWLRSTLTRQGAVVVEPWLRRRVDLSLQVSVGPDGAQGEPRLTRFFADARGQYRAHVVGDPLSGLTSDVLRVVHGDGGRAPSVLRVLDDAARFVAEHAALSGYRGPLGIDAFLHEREEGLGLRPIVELNPRWTMGALALELAAHVRPGCVGLWLHVGRAEWESAGHADAMALRDALPPARVEGAPPRLASGAVCTTDPRQAEARLSVLAVGANLRACVAQLEAVGLQALPK